MKYVLLGLVVVLLGAIIVTTNAKENVVVDFGASKGSIPQSFYGVHVGPWGGETSRIDTNNDGREDIFSDFEAHRAGLEDAQISILRRDMDLDNMANPDFSFNYYENNPANMQIVKSQVAWAAATNRTMLLETTFMPPWLAKNDSLCATKRSTCEPNDYRVWGSLILRYLDEVGCDEHPGTCEIEIWNEPYLHLFFLSDASCEQRIEGYIRMYTNTRAAIKAKYPNMLVGGPSGYIGDECSKKFTTEFLRRVPPEEVDFVAVHNYADAKLSNQITETMELIRDTGHGKNVKITEFGAASAAVDTGDPQKHEFVLASAFLIAASTEPTITSMIQFQWADRNKYADGLPHYAFHPHRRELFSERALDDARFTGYRVSKMLGTLHPEGSTIVSTEAPGNLLVLATTGYNGQHISVANTFAVQSVELSFDLAGVSARSIIDARTGEEFDVRGNSVSVGSLPAKSVRYFTVVPK